MKCRKFVRKFAFPVVFPSNRFSLIRARNLSGEFVLFPQEFSVVLGRVGSHMRRQAE